MTLHPRSMRGMTLIEIMVATAIMVVILAGAVGAGLALQRRALFEEQTSLSQEDGLAAKDLIGPLIEKAGSGLGSANIVNLGGAYNQYTGDAGYAVLVSTGAAIFSGSPSFAQPSAPYASMVSDSLEVRSADSSSLGQIASRSVSGSATVLLLTTPTDAGSPIALGDGGITDVVLFNPSLGVSCIHRLTAVSGITLTLGNPGSSNPTDTGVPSTTAEPCDKGCTSILPVGNQCNFFSGPTKSYVAALNYTGLRVNWVNNNTPVLEQSDPTSPTGFSVLSRQVERMTVRLGVTDNADAGYAVRWYPDPTWQSAPKGIDQCTIADLGTNCATPSGLWDSSKDDTSTTVGLRNALMRRVRMVEVTLTARSIRQDQSAIQKSGSNFVIDSEGNPMDGYKRRTYVFRSAPLNFSVAGIK